MAHARHVFAGNDRVLFVRRIITRQADAAAEDHDTMTVEAFERARSAGEFAVSWPAHGLWYALPGSAIAHVQRGGVAIANCSRSALGEVSAAFVNVRIANITASPHILAQRLAGRGRESAADIRARLERQVDQPLMLGAVTIDNSGALEVAGARFAELVQDLLAKAEIG